MPDLIRHPEKDWIPAFAGMTAYWTIMRHLIKPKTSPQKRPATVEKQDIRFSGLTPDRGKDSCQEIGMHHLKILDMERPLENLKLCKVRC